MDVFETVAITTAAGAKFKSQSSLKMDVFETGKPTQ